MSAMRRGNAVAVAIAAALVGVTGCGAPMEIFTTASDDSARAARLAWFMIILATIVFAGVMATMVLALRRNRERNANDVSLTDPGTGWIVWGGAVMPARRARHDLRRGDWRRWAARRKRGRR